MPLLCEEEVTRESSSRDESVQFSLSLKLLENGILKKIPLSQCEMAECKRCSVGNTHRQFEFEEEQNACLQLLACFFLQNSY